MNSKHAIKHITSNVRLTSTPKSLKTRNPTNPIRTVLIMSLVSMYAICFIILVLLSVLSVDCCGLALFLCLCLALSYITTKDFI